MAALAQAFAYALRPFADALTFLTTTRVHPTLFPYPWASTLHATRVSMAYQNNMRRTGSKLSWGTYITGYLIMCWGGMVLSHTLLSIPSPILFCINPYINYIVPHLVVTILFAIFPNILTSPNLDLVLFPLDGLLRANAVTSTLAMISSNPAIDSKLTSSALFHIIIGAVVSCGGGASAATLKTWTPEWSFGTPVFLRSGVGFWGSLDVWAGSLVAVVYSAMTVHPAFDEVVPFEVRPAFALSSLGAKAVSSYIYTILFGLRVWKAKLSSLAGVKKGKGKTKIQ
ncbi:uncharacterized protein BT62DRAFT_962721 [Guyanagaster necrorhizus]|uniref:Uncharacterized protein n=1 Tax=Guyanagaster necrorhizus TaxID=856835 RepID=A0A9P7W286_9AGAR|nr:uncharacterized protein BT62DRAFT_962721 [Guyanagaster necrorhizus MCA 3950]KAG7450863.1 hypothetical protein BT62DRAFT_962721 [Guyanagaster necrorhizus MCA 3950]